MNSELAEFKYKMESALENIGVGLDPKATVFIRGDYLTYSAYGSGISVGIHKTNARSGENAIYERTAINLRNIVRRMGAKDNS